MKGLAELSRFPGISLHDLNAVAPAMTRVDRKYVLPVPALPAVLTEIRLDAAAVLQIDGCRAFRYESVYFDTPDLVSHSLTALSRRHRFKLRTRRYVETGETWFEVKTRGPRGVTVKERVRCDDRAAPSRITPEAAALAAARLGAAGVLHVDISQVLPTLTTRYRRSCLVLPDSGTRVTIDLDLSWAAPCGPLVTIPKVAVLETKNVPGVVSVFDHVAWRHGFRPTRLSKYGTGLALVRPGVPSHKWQRTLRRDLLPHLTQHGGRACA